MELIEKYGHLLLTLIVIFCGLWIMPKVVALTILSFFLLTIGLAGWAAWEEEYL